MEKKQEETAALNGNGGGVIGGPPQCGEGFVHDGGMPGKCISASEALGLPTAGGAITGGIPYVPDPATSIVDPIINPDFANVSVQAIDPALMALNFV